MTWLTWRQFRTQAVVAFGALAVIAVILAVTGPQLVHLYDTIVATCAAHGDCSTVDSAFLRNDRSLQIALDALPVIVPGIIGIFWGAPLVAHEMEAGTFRLAWTQSVSRTRWLAVKLGIIGLASMALAGLLSLMATWWSSPVDRVNMNVYVSFDQRDIVPIGYAAFAFALGVTAGLLIRRTIPAMAATLIAFIFARLAFSHWIRPSHLVAPMHAASALDPTNPGWGYGTTSLGGQSSLMAPTPNIPNAWVFSTQLVDKAGHSLTPRFVASACPLLGKGLAGPAPSVGIGAGGSHTEAPVGAQQQLQACVAKVGATFHEVVSYQPASHYWELQWYELAIFLAGALALAGFCFWWIRRLS